MDWKRNLNNKPKQQRIAGFYHSETGRFLTYKQLCKLPKEEVVTEDGKPNGWVPVSTTEYMEDKEGKYKHQPQLEVYKFPPREEKEFVPMTNEEIKEIQEKINAT